MIILFVYCDEDKNYWYFECDCEEKNEVTGKSMHDVITCKCGMKWELFSEDYRYKVRSVEPEGGMEDGTVAPV